MLHPCAQSNSFALSATHSPTQISRFAPLKYRAALQAGAGAPNEAESELTYLRPGGPLDCSDGQVLHDWCLAGHGIAWRSTWEVEGEIAAGLLVPVLEEFAAPPNGIYAILPHATRHLPLRVRLWVDFLRQRYGDPAFWRAAAQADS